MSQANTAELLMVDLINEERAAAGVAPLTVDDDLNTSSETHSAWMLENDVFSHTGAGGSSSTDRILDAGYVLEGSWATGENIGWQSERGNAGLEDDVRAIHESLMNSPEHRENILNPNFDEVGIGIEQGDFDAATGTFDAVMVTQNFGRTDADDGDDPAPDDGISATPEQTIAESDPVDDMPGDDPVVEEPEVDDTVADDAGDDPVMAGPGDDDTAADDADEDLPDEDPVMAGQTDDDVTDDPVIEDPVDDDEMPDSDTTTDDTTTDDDDAVITRDFVVTRGSVTNDVTETVTVDADGTTDRVRTETMTDTSEDGEAFNFDELADVFDFGSFELDDGAAGTTMSDAEFTFAGPDGTVTTDDPAEFEALLAEFFGEPVETSTCSDALFV